MCNYLHRAIDRSDNPGRDRLLAADLKRPALRKVHTPVSRNNVVLEDNMKKIAMLVATVVLISATSARALPF
jgi:hypothetical protein